jgi:hypothetical protein
MDGERGVVVAFGRFYIMVKPRSSAPQQKKGVEKVRRVQGSVATRDEASCFLSGAVTVYMYNKVYQYGGAYAVPTQCLRSADSAK